MSKEHFQWGNVTFTVDTPLYADWGYFQRIAGGLNNVGVGIPLGSISAGWTHSLWDLFKRKTKEKTVNIETDCNMSEVVVRGFLKFIEHVEADGKASTPTIELEGANWCPAAICPKRFGTIRYLKSHPWMLVYFRTDGFMFPLELWEKLEQPINLFAEVVPAGVKTEIGTKPCFLKVRSAAFLQS